ncbi:hypothetical protein KIW84_011239 [Lathyrus oleraceus]|uniref:Uncharacterized protein n=1 Tax=Pisum sativum TaxID=3888 RepID=A0A9D4YM66_PEA|nr:hypothetical protein KIW84_011239 [Pisum sativum]
MIASAPSDFTEMVNMGMRLEEGVREGRLTREEGSSAKCYGSFAKKKDGEAHVVTSHVKPSVAPQICTYHFWRPGLLFDRANCLKSSLRGNACVCLKLSQAGKVLQVRQLVEGRDMQSIPHYSCCVIPLLTLLCVDALGYKPKILYKVYSVRVFEYRRVPTFWTHAHLSISSPWPGIRAVRSHPHFILSSASP